MTTPNAPEDDSSANHGSEDDARRLVDALERLRASIGYGLSESDLANINRVLTRAIGAAATKENVKDAIVDEDATYICTRAEEVVTAVNGLFLTAERLMKLAEDIRDASDDFRRGVEWSNDDNY